MAGLELLSDQGIRMDGRRPTELRRIFCKLGVSASADGSSYFEQGNTKVLATVYGPHDVSKGRSKAFNDRAFINCELRSAPFSTSGRNKVSRNDRRSQEMSIILRQAFEATILTSQHPGSQIDIFFLVLYSDGGTCSACINAGTLALINAGIPIKDYLCACSAGFVNETPLMDINHFEGFLGGTELNLALLRKSEAIVCDEMTSRIHKDHMTKLREAAMRGCHDIYAVLEATFQGPRMIIPIVIGAIALGRSFDMKDASPKPHYIFDSADLTSNLKVIPRTFTQSQYRLIESSSDSSDLLDVDGEFSLKVKQGQFGLQGYGKYLSSTVNRDKTVEMLITVYHETQTETFPSYTKLRTDWQQRPQREVGTHYIRSITYGGQLIISYQLKATKDEYMEEIKAAVSANLALSGKLDVDVTGKLEKLTKKVADKSTVTISAYATAAGTFSPPTSIEACLKLVDEYPEMVKKLNDGKGAPLKIELVELASLQSNYSAYLKNYALDGMLNAATDKYDDIRVAMSEYKSWEGQGQIWPDEEEKMINAYQRKLKEANRAMSTAISNLDATGDLEQFDEAFKVYGEGPENIPNKYTRDLKKLIYTVEKKPFYWFPFTKAVSHYIHWGSVNCSLPSPEPLFIGYAGTSPKGFGNGGNVECLRARNPSLEPKPFGKGTVVSQINGLLYELPDKSTGQVLCSFCKLENATAAYTIAGRTECPNEMKLEYSGFLSTSRDAGTGSAMVCLDKNPESDIPSEYTKADSEAATLVPLWMVCPDCDEDENKKYVSCVLCSR